MMDATAFARMKQGAVFITTARGGIHDEAALLDALRRDTWAAPASTCGTRSRRRSTTRCSG